MQSSIFTYVQNDMKSKGINKWLHPGYAIIHGKNYVALTKNPR